MCHVRMHSLCRLTRLADILGAWRSSDRWRQLATAVADDVRGNFWKLGNELTCYNFPQKTRKQLGES